MSRKNFDPYLLVVQLDETQKYELLQALTAPGRFYGGIGTIHNSDKLDVIVDNGVVTGVWFRCQLLPFKQCSPGAGTGNPDMSIKGVVVEDN